MEEVDYLKVNPEYGDTMMDLVFAQRVKEIIDEYKITTWFETGVDVGTTALTVTKMVENWIGAEIRPGTCERVAKRFADNNVTNIEIINGNSSVVLLNKMHTLDAEHTIFYLDAHWGAYWPLLDEIDTISRGKGVIIIHDFQVPGHPELGWMEHDGKILNYDYVKDALTRWSPTHRIEYNSEAKYIHPRGILYVFPK
jgi:hypothetical protein